MAFPPLRTDVAIKRFKDQLSGFDYDLDAWRATVEGRGEYAVGFAVLDRDGGWKLLQDCLREKPQARISSAAAASSSFCR